MLPRAGGNTDMSIIEQNKKLIIRYFEEVWNRGELEVLDELIASDYINHSPGGNRSHPPLTLVA
jgi:hypothetical protein